MELMEAHAAHDILVISDSDVRVTPDYLRSLALPFADPKVGAVTCLYRGVAVQGGLWSRLDAVGMSVEMTAGVLVARSVEGMQFVLGPTMAFRRETIRRMGGFRVAADLHSDDFVLGNETHKLGETVLTPDVRAKEDETARRMFVLRYVQPGLAGLMDGSVSTLAPLFAAAFATHNTWETFLVGLAASVGAGISMAFAEALSDDGSLTGRGTPWIRGSITGAMTAVGGLGHTMPYLIPDFWVATVVAFAVVVIELIAISWIRHRYMDTPFLSAAFQVMVGGALVFAAGILIGSS